MDWNMISPDTKNSKDLGGKLLSFEPIKICSSQYLIACNGLIKWPKYNWMTCIHGIGTSVVHHLVSNIPIYNQIVKFDILINHKQGL